MPARVISMELALAEGYSRREVTAHIAARRWIALRRGVYFTNDRLPDSAAAREAVRVQAAVLATAVPSVGSHESAALVHGLPLFRPYTGPVLVSRQRERRAERPAARTCARLVSQVPDCDRTDVLGARVTTLGRTAVDLARTRPALSAVIALDAALRRGLSRADLLAVLDRQRGWPGSVVAARHVSFADKRSESALESIGRYRFHQQDLPVPRLQVVLGDLDHAIGRVDFYFEAQRTIAEADGALKYAPNPDDPDEALRTVYEEKLREDAFRLAGYGFFRFSWAEAAYDPAVLGTKAEKAFSLAVHRG